MSGIDRGRYYRPSSATATAAAHIPLTTRASHASGMYVGVPVFADHEGREHLPLILTAHGWASPAELVWRPTVDLGTDAGEIDPEHLDPLEDRLAEMLLLRDLVPAIAVAPTRGRPPGDAPRWGATYYSGPPIGGQTKRWVVISHDVHNASTGRSICVRTTSNLAHAHPAISPLVEGGAVVAVGTDVVSKGSARFDLASAPRLPQCTSVELRKVARCVTNALALHRAAGLTPRPG